MISINELNGLKKYLEIQANVTKNRPIYVITEGDVITWKKDSDVFDLDGLKIGDKMSSKTSAVLAASQNKVLTDIVPEFVYGRKLLVNSIPIVNEAGDAIGAFTTLNTRLHPITSAFNHFAPILVEMFPEGAILYMTDLKKFTYKQSSSIFNLPVNEVGDEIKEGDIVDRTIRTKKMVIEEVNASHYGIPLLVASYPLFDEDDENQVIETLGMVIPKKTAAQLREMSENLDNGLSGISAAIEELAAAASQIHENEKALNLDIKEIINLSDAINQISVFIKEIADETKMLGLNAAIEAARAGEAGRGFGVVAEEIRKLSEESKSTVPKIKELTDNIKNTVDKVITQSNSSLSSSQEQAAASEEITASIEEITSMAEELNRVSKQL